jgi:hypothetical protein
VTRIGNICGVLALAGLALAAAARQDVQNARTAVQAQYERLAEAIRQNNVDAILAIDAPGYTSVNPNGSTMDYVAMERYTRQLSGAVVSVIYIRNIIRRFTASGNTAVADVCQEFSRIQRIGDGKPHRVDTSALQRETWTHLFDGWRRIRVENVHGTRWFVDGVRVDSSKPYQYGMPPFVPKVDPPTGCGIR